MGPPSLPPSGELYPGDHWSSGDPWHNYMAAQMAVTGGSYSAHQMYHSARSVVDSHWSKYCTLIG